MIAKKKSRMKKRWFSSRCLKCDSKTLRAVMRRRALLWLRLRNSWKRIMITLLQPDRCRMKQQEASEWVKLANRDKRKLRINSKLTQSQVCNLELRERLKRKALEVELLVSLRTKSSS